MTRGARGRRGVRVVNVVNAQENAHARPSVAPRRSARVTAESMRLLWVVVGECVVKRTRKAGPRVAIVEA